MNASFLHERKNVVGRTRLLSDAGAEASKESPAEKGSRSSGKNSPKLQEHDSCRDKESHGYERK